MGVVVSYLVHSILAKPQPYEPKMAELTADNVTMIKRTWEVPQKDLTGSGEAILLQLFEKYPHNQDKFQSFKNTPLLSLKGTPGFRTHARRLMDLVDKSINLLGQENGLAEITNLWKVMGANHFRRGIEKKSFEEVKEVVIGILTEACGLSEDDQAVWGALFDTVFSIAFTKYE